VLQRFVEVLMAAIRGDGSDDARARLAQAAARKDTLVKKALDAVIDAHMTDASPAKVRALLDSVRDEVGKPARF
jgi:lipopolysaccharide biosynthesis regulator YciM